MAGLINFEDENEVKQFLDNLGVEYSFQCYKEKDPEGKLAFAVNGAEKLNRDRDWKVVSTSSFYHCDVCVFFFLGCQRLADYLEGVKKNYESTAQVLKHNCETNKHGESCYKLGAYHVAGKGEKKSFPTLQKPKRIVHENIHQLLLSQITPFFF